MVMHFTFFLCPFEKSHWLSSCLWIIMFLDIDECLSNPCHKKACCSSAGESYTCKCYDGYTGNGTTCIGI